MAGNFHLALATQGSLHDGRHPGPAFGPQLPRHFQGDELQSPNVQADLPPPKSPPRLGQHAFRGRRRKAIVFSILWKKARRGHAVLACPITAEYASNHSIRSQRNDMFGRPHRRHDLALSLAGGWNRKNCGQSIINCPEHRRHRWGTTFLNPKKPCVAVVFFF